MNPFLKSLCAYLKETILPMPATSGIDNATPQNHSLEGLNEVQRAFVLMGQCSNEAG